MIEKIRSVWNSEGFRGIIRNIYHRVFQPKLKSFGNYFHLFSNKYGLEFGGPSSIFRRNGQFPVYKVAKDIDNCNFNFNTIWEGTISPGRTFSYDKKQNPGWQYVGDATDLSFIPVHKKYDFLLSFHVLEHIANPIKVLNEWIRSLTPQGVVALGVPHKENTFDCYREVTLLSHMVDDYKNNISEDDLTHLDEVLNFHDFSLDSGQINKEDFVRMIKNNHEYRVLHHHVFSTKLVIQLLDYVGLQILTVETFLPWHILILAQKALNPELVDNANFLLDTAEYTQRNIFSIDRVV